MVNSIEINDSFYSLQRPSSYQAWYDATPANFIFSANGSSAALEHWAERLRAWAAGKQPGDAKTWINEKPPTEKKRDLFVYFDNDVKVKAPFDAMAAMLGDDAPGESVRGADGSPISPKLSKKALAERVRSHWPAESKAVKRR